MCFRSLVLYYFVQWNTSEWQWDNICKHSLLLPQSDEIKVAGHCSLIVGCINGNAGLTKTRMLGYAAYHYGEYIIVPFVCGLANLY